MTADARGGFAGLTCGTGPSRQHRRRFFIDGTSKGEIAGEFGLSRFKVARIFDDARAAGIVRIEIRLPAGLDSSLAHRLRETFGLRHAIVVDTPEGPEAQMRQRLAHASKLETLSLGPGKVKKKTVIMSRIRSNERSYPG
jgi:hypothetical protein